MVAIGAAAIGAAGTIGGAAINASSSGGGGGRGHFAGFQVEGQDVANVGSNTPAFRTYLTNDENGFLQGYTNRLNTPGLQAINARFPRILAGYDMLRGQVQPGFGALTSAGVNALANARTKATGDLKSNLNRRKVLGSSFANDAQARVQAEFAQQEAQFRAQTKLQEIDAYNKLLQTEFSTIQKELSRDLAESSFSASVQQQLIDVMRGAQGQLQQAAASNPFGDALGTISAPLLGYGIEQLLGPSATSGAIPAGQYNNIVSQAGSDISSPAYGSLF